MITYLNNNNNNNFWIADIETDDLDATRIWIVVVKNIVSGEILKFFDKETFNVWYSGNDRILCGHNFISFDAPTLNRLWDSNINLDSCCDTLVLSLLYNPGIDGGHSLEAWGKRLVIFKGEFSDWSSLSEDMIKYCIQDVEVTYELYKQLSAKMVKIGFSEQSAEIEHKIRQIINVQQQNGFYFNRLGAQELSRKLRRLQSDLSTDIQRLFPPQRTLVKNGTIRRTKDGSPFASFTNSISRYYDVVIQDNDTYECYDLKEFNIGSPKQRVERLLELGWEPTEFTPKGFPKVDEESLIRFADSSGRPEINALAEWLVLQGRASMIDTWLNNLGPDSRIHGRINSCGATTRRMIHSAPNTANIPSGAKAKYGHECRALWGVEQGKNLVLVGYDAAGLETAGLCHYLNNRTATEILLRAKPDDVHTANAKRLSEALGRPVDREWGAKTTWYAWLYGAGLKKLGAILKGSAADGQAVVDTFFHNVPGLKKLIKDVQKEWQDNDGLLRTIDGGFVRCPSKSAALNYKIQSLGAILMKLASILLDQRAKEQGIPFKKVGDIHDEGQLETLKEYADRLGKLAVLCIEEAGRQLNLNVPVTGDYKIGDNWSETH